MAGRPTQYTEQLADSIVERLVERSLRRICQEDSDVPDRNTVARWMVQHPDFGAKCARARREHALYRLEMVEDDVDSIEPENANAVRVKVDYAKWLAERLQSKDYGNKVQNEHSGEIAVKRVVSDL